MSYTEPHDGPHNRRVTCVFTYMNGKWLRDVKGYYRTYLTDGYWCRGEGLIELPHTNGGLFLCKECALRFGLEW